MANAQSAFADYHTVIKRQPSAVTYYSRGNTPSPTFHSREYKPFRTRTGQTWDRAIALEPRFARAYMSRGLIHEYSEEHTSATADYTHALELLTETIQTWQGDPNALIQAHYWCALIYQKLGEVAKVEKEIHEANRRVFSFFVEKLQKM